MANGLPSSLERLTIRNCSYTILPSVPALLQLANLNTLKLMFGQGVSRKVDDSNRDTMELEALHDGVELTCYYYNDV